MRKSNGKGESIWLSYMAGKWPEVGRLQIATEDEVPVLCEANNLQMYYFSYEEGKFANVFLSRFVVKL